MRQIDLCQAVLMAAILGFTGCGLGEDKPAVADVRPAIEVLLADVRTAQRHLGEDLARATAYKLDRIDEVRQLGPPMPSDRPDRWRVRVAVRGAFTATITPLAELAGPPSGPTAGRPTGAISGADPAPAHKGTKPQLAPVGKPVIATREFNETFDVYLAREANGTWQVP